MTSNHAELNSDPSCEFIKNEEGIIIKDEFATSLENETKQCILRGICNHDQAFQLPEKSTAADPKHGCAGELTSITAALEPSLQGDSSTFNSLIKQEDIKDEVDDSQHSEDVQYLFTWKVLEDQSHIVTLAEGGHGDSGPRECTTVNGNLDQSLVTQTDQNIIKGAIDQHSTAQKHSSSSSIHKTHNDKNSVTCEREKNSITHKSILSQHIGSDTQLLQWNIYQNRTSKESFAARRMKINTSDKPFKCKLRYCEKSIYRSEKSFECDTCDYTTTGKTYLQRHMRTHARFECEFCLYTTSLKATLIEHMQTHMREKTYKCELCSYSTTLNSTLSRHIQTHTGKTQYKCKDCNYSTAYRRELVRHIQIHTGKMHFKCEFCDYSASQKATLLTHIQTHTGDKRYKCEVCNYGASFKSQLAVHMQTHTGEKCELCDYSTLFKYKFVVHMRTHAGQKPFKCHFCNYSVKKKALLVTHIQTHTQRNELKCGLCDYRAMKKRSLLQHMYIHMGHKPFKCELCNYQTVRKASLLGHIPTHTGHKPLKCGLCIYSAVQKCTLVRHIQNSHKKIVM